MPFCRRFATVVGLVLATAACRPSSTPVVDGDTARILAADAEPGNWLSHGRTYSEQRYSPLKAITTDTVSRLGLAWDDRKH